MKTLLISTLLGLTSLAAASEICVLQESSSEKACFKDLRGTYYVTHESLEKLQVMDEVNLLSDFRVISEEEYNYVGDVLETSKKKKPKGNGNGSGNGNGNGNGSNNGSSNGNGNTVIIALPGSTINIGGGKTDAPKPKMIE